MKDVDPLSRLERLHQETLDSLDAVRRVGEILSETFDEDQICRKTVRIFVQYLPFENCSILLLEKSRGVLRLRAAAGKADDQLDAKQRAELNRNLEIRVGEGVAGEVVKTGRPVVLTDAGRNPQFKVIPSPIPIRSLLCLPVLSKEEIIGVMNLSHPEIEEISVDQAQMLEVLSKMVGQAITISRLNAELISERLRRSERLIALGQLSASVAHEVNNPLTNILLRAQKLQTVEALDDRQQRMASEIQEESEKIAAILGNLLDFSRVRHAASEPTDVNATLNKTLNLTVPLQSTRSRITVRKELESSLPKALANPHELEQVFTNLIINAVEAIKGKGEIHITTGFTPSTVEARICDTGCGLSQDQLDKIFEPFYTTRVDEGGTGLGLAVCKQILRNYDGDLRVESELGSGSTFTVVLPQARNEKPVKVG